MVSQKRTKPKKAKAEKVLPVATWKRVVLFCCGIAFVVLSIVAAFQPADRVSITAFWQWVIVAMLALFGFWLLTLSFWGRRKDVDQALNSLTSGL